MKLTTTLNLIRACSPCGLEPNSDGTLKGYLLLTKHLGEPHDLDTEINLLTILKSNGVQDMLWCLRATIQDSRRTASQLAIEFADQVLPIFEAKYPDDNRPRAAIQAAKDFNAGSISLEALQAAWGRAYAAAYTAAADADAAAAADAAYAAYAAADAYAVPAVPAAAAADAAYAAARKSAVEKQAETIRMILEY